LVDPTKDHFFRWCETLVDADVVPGLKTAHQDTTQFPASFLDDYVFFKCFTCSNLYYGGGKDCQAGMRGGGNKEHRVCPTCAGKATGVATEACGNGHGVEYIAFKCKFCCTVANWFHGGMNYCEKCNLKSAPGPEIQECQCTIQHKLNGQDGAFLGCVLCNPSWLGKKDTNK